MSLAQKLTAKLDGPSIDGTVVGVGENGEKLVARVDKADVLAVTLLELRLETNKLSGAPMAHVRQVAELLTKQVNYLLEPIQPIEADAEACVVQMRSTKPEQSGGAATYYEVLVKTGGTISLHRYEKPKGGLRKETPMHLTKEVVRRLAGDFLEAVA